MRNSNPQFQMNDLRHAGSVLSVIIPSCNMEKYLSGCLESLVGVDGVEAIVVNDGSKDATSRIAHEFAAKYPETVKVIDKPNGHYGSCINAGLPVATGTYVKILDADDRFDPAALKKLVVQLPSCDVRGIDVVFTDFVLVHEGGGADNLVSCGLPQDLDFDLATVAAFKRLQTMHTLTYRTSILREMDYRQAEGMPYTDNEWALKPMRKVGKMVYYPLPLYRYLVGRPGQSVSLEQSVKNVRNLETILEHMIAEYQRPDGDETFRSYARKFVTHNARLVYDIAFFALPIKDGQAKLKGWEERLKLVATESFGDLASAEFDRRLKWRYIAGWRNKSIMAGAYMCVVRMAKWAFEKQRRLRGL